MRAFEQEEARECVALTALGLPIPSRAGLFEIEAVGVGEWARYFGNYGFRSLDVTPPRFDIPPDVHFVEYAGTQGEEAGLADGGTAAGYVAVVPSDRRHAPGEPREPSHPDGSVVWSERLWVSRDPYALYRLLRKAGLDRDEG